MNRSALNPGLARTLITVNLAAVAAALVIVAVSVPAHALNSCKAKLDKKTGTVLIDASGITGTLLWGAADGDETNVFANEATCITGNRAKKCLLGPEGSLESITPPSSCFVYLAADSPIACAVYVRGCTPVIRDPADVSDGVGCWDLNDDRVCDTASEDANFDGVCDVLDCRGPEGPQGLQGPTGDEGAAGQAGSEGPQGSAGDEGPAGAQGLPGNDGATGPSGSVGAQGATGAQGAAGATGATGARGRKGNRGEEGDEDHADRPAIESGRCDVLLADADHQPTENVVVGGAEVEGIIDQGLFCADAVLVLQRFDRDGGGPGVGHFHEAGNAPGCRGTRLRPDTGFPGQAGFTEMHLIVDQTG